MQHLGEVAERVALHVQRVGRFQDGDRLAGEGLRLHVVAAAGVDERLDLSPECLRQQVVRCRVECAPEFGERLGLVVAAELAERSAEQRRVGLKEADRAARFGEVAEAAEAFGCAFVVAGGLRDEAEHEVDVVVAAELAPPPAGLARELGGSSDSRASAAARLESAAARGVGSREGARRSWLRASSAGSGP